jgi:hypothetical protein
LVRQSPRRGRASLALNVTHNAQASPGPESDEDPRTAVTQDSGTVPLEPLVCQFSQLGGEPVGRGEHAGTVGGVGLSSGQPRVAGAAALR